MRPRTPDASDGGGRGTHRELAREREEKSGSPYSEAHERMMEAMLVASGERGYRAVSVRDVLERTGGHRVQFYERFADKADCYAVAYAVHAERLCGEVLRGGAAGGLTWRDGLLAALEVLGRFLRTDLALARGVLVEVHVAGGPALVRRGELLERLSRAMDSARRQPGSSHSPPPETAAFMIGAIESAVFSASIREDPERFATELAPELAWMISAAYFGEEEAGAARQRLLGLGRERYGQV